MILSKRVFVPLCLVMAANLIFAGCQIERATASPQAQIATHTTEVVATPLAEKEGDTAVATNVAVIAPEFKHPDTYTAFLNSPDSLDPARSGTYNAFAVQSNIYEAVVQSSRDSSDDFVPILATSWQVNPAGDVWTFNLREGVTFHAGGTLEPHDVAYSMQRALLQDRSLESFFGLHTIEELAVETAGVASFEQVPPEALVATCERVKGAVTADDAAGTVTYRLARPIPWFLALLSLDGKVVDMEWMVKQGAWDGDCTTWVQYHDLQTEDTVLFNQSNGTGPYLLDHWTSGEEIVLVANENYWRQAGDPAWEGGLSGRPRIKRVVWKTGDVDFDTRLALFQAGDVDTLDIPPQQLARFEPFYKTVCQPDGRCEEVNPDGYIQAWRELLTNEQQSVLLNQQINVAGDNPFVGSGQLDGDGIPPDFFQDVHVRRAFNYCFDFDAAIAGELDGDGIQSQGPIIAGLLGYREGEAPLYIYDLARCEEEFRQAFDGELWKEGFSVQMAYNSGNEFRRVTYEILKAGVEAVNPGFVIEVVALPWAVLRNHRNAGELPTFVGGWIGDFPDPHNWVNAYLHSQGDFSHAINMPEEIAAEYDALIEAAASRTKVEERRPLYEQLQLKAQEDAVVIWLVQPVNRAHLQRWIQGFSYTSEWANYIYGLSKEAP
jgi:peptide/nickel transport system substrate-binding protein